MTRTGIWGDQYRICMTSKTGKKLYLEVTDSWYKGNELIRRYGWTWNKGTAMVFDREEQAIKIAKEHFKNFNGWFIDKTIDYLGCI